MGGCHGAVSGSGGLLRCFDGIPPDSDRRIDGNRAVRAVVRYRVGGGMGDDGKLYGDDGYHEEGANEIKRMNQENMFANT